MHGNIMENIKLNISENKVKKIVHMRDVGHRSTGEIASSVGVALSTVRYVFKNTR